MSEEIKQENSLEETIKVIKEEYEKQILELKQKHEEELKKVRDEEHEKTVQTIRAVMSGRQIEVSENPAPKEEISFEEQLIRDTKENLNLK